MCVCCFFCLHFISRFSSPYNIYIHAHTLHCKFNQWLDRALKIQCNIHFKCTRRKKEEMFLFFFIDKYFDSFTRISNQFSCFSGALHIVSCSYSISFQRFFAVVIWCSEQEWGTVTEY